MSSQLTDAEGRYDPALVAKTLDAVTARMAGQQAGHGMDHVLRVLQSARTIQTEVGGNRLVVELAALLHDLGDAKFHGGVERSAEFARQILNEFGASIELIDQVAGIVDNISFRKGVDGRRLSLEGQIVQDADRLDALGAIGIVRTIEYGAALGQPYLPEPHSEQTKCGLGHFHEKLFKLRDLMNTLPGRRIAEQREKFMREFLDQFFAECGSIVPIEDFSVGTTEPPCMRTQDEALRED